MGGGLSFLYQKSLSTSEQTAQSSITQQYSGTCNIACNNTLDNVNIILNNAQDENITLTQSCTANGQCNFSNNMASLADIYFQAGNNAAALPGGLNFGNISISNSETDSRAYISENISNVAKQECNVNSTNQMNNVFIAASNVDYGNITIAQNGNSSGSCVLNNLMNATAEAASLVDNCSTSGGKGYKACSGKGTSWGYIILYIIIALIAIVGLSIVARIMMSGKSSGASSIPSGSNSVSAVRLAELAG